MDTAVKPVTKWNAGLYNEKHSFVFKYGEDLVDLLNPQPGESILDLGCGTGYLSDRIAASGSVVTGMDNSGEMIEKAQKAYPHLDFRLMSAVDFQFEKPFDAIFSNAVLHWITEKQKVVDCMYKNLKNNGRIVIELGGKNNVDSILAALKKVLVKNGYERQAEKQIWYFPSLSEYTGILENRGFRVIYATHFDRKTALSDNKNGIKDWLEMFCKVFFEEIDLSAREKLLDEIQELLRPTNFINNQWFADYKRLRIIAIKQ
jgi:trans-aconitate methyltransferase